MDDSGRSERSRHAPPRTDLGLARTGARLDGPAPIDAIPGTRANAPFKDCNGHANPNFGYHNQAVTGCLREVEKAKDVEPKAETGIAMRDDPIVEVTWPARSEHIGLSTPHRHVQESDAYHHHANDVGDHAMLSCPEAEASTAVSDSCGICEANALPYQRL